MSTDQPATPEPNTPRQQPIAANLAQSIRSPRRIILEQPLGIGRKIAMSGLLFALGISIMISIVLWANYKSYMSTDPTISEHFHSGTKHASQKIAVIRVSGTIMSGEGFVKRQIDWVAEDENVKGIVLRVDSPGGTVTGSHYIYHHLKKLAAEKKVPLVVSMGSLAASGGYYVSMAVGDAPDTIFAEPTTWTGSIGVIIPNYDFSAMLADWKIEDRSFTSGPFKQLGSPTRKMDEDDKAVMQALVDESFDDFRNIVRSGRPDLTDDDLAKATTGQVFTAKQARDLGLVDKLGFIEDAIDRVKELASLEETPISVVEFRRPTGLLNIPLGGQQAQSLELRALLDLTTPRAYYLFTHLPTLMSGQAN